MLETLSIRNIAVIDSAQILFKPGLNIISGETGAGKSIVIEAIALLLGSRANVELIRTGCDEGIVEGLFDTSRIAWIHPRLERHGFSSADSSQLLIKRIIHRAGRHRIYVNGELATSAILQDLCEGLIDLCGQHEHQSLLKPHIQLDLLDRYGNLASQTRNFAEAFSHFRSLCRERDILQSAESDRSKKADFLKFQIGELKKADLQPYEDDQLQKEKTLLTSAQSRLQLAETVRQFIESDDSGILSSTRASVMRLKSLSQIDPRVEQLREGMERALAETEEVSIALNRYLGLVDLNPERLQAVQERLAQFAELRRKYGPTVNSMLGTLSELEREYLEMETTSERLSEVERDVDLVRTDLLRFAKKLSQSRRKTADLLSKSVTDELKDLKMGDAKLRIETSDKEDMQTWTVSGADAIQFIVQTNRGESAKPLGKIASGGELSRIMLAIRRVIADRGGIGVYLFDEIDSGMGGQTAFEVGRKLKSVASYNQVICITHLPQVASFADHHLSVRKTTQGHRTLTQVVEMNSQERTHELARMLGGPKLTKKSIENAAELLSMAKKSKEAENSI